MKIYKFELEITRELVVPILVSILLSIPLAHLDAFNWEFIWELAFWISLSSLSCLTLSSIYTYLKNKSLKYKEKLDALEKEKQELLYHLEDMNSYEYINILLEILYTENKAVYIYDHPLMNSHKFTSSDFYITKYELGGMIHIKFESGAFKLIKEHLKTEGYLTEFDEEVCKQAIKGNMNYHVIITSIFKDKGQKWYKDVLKEKAISESNKK